METFTRSLNLIANIFARFKVSKNRVSIYSLFFLGKIMEGLGSSDKGFISMKVDNSCFFNTPIDNFLKN